MQTSILKARSRDLLREHQNRVRFELLANRSLGKVLAGIEADDPNSMRDYNDYLRMIRDECISEADFMSAVQEGRECIDLLTQYRDLAQALLELDWLRQPADAVVQYQLLLVDLLSAHSKFAKFAVRQLVAKLVPRDVDQYMWSGGRPASVEIQLRCDRVLETLGCVLEVIPLSQRMVLDELDALFPFHTRPSFVVAGFLCGVLRLMVSRPELRVECYRLVMSKLIILDCYTPREEIELAEYEDSDEEDDDDSDDADADADDIFKMELNAHTANGSQKAATEAAPSDQMKSVQAETLDLCMEQLFAYLEGEYRRESHSKTSTTFAMLLDTFQTMLLPAHNTHHVQFVLFYYSSFSAQLAETLAHLCWQRTRDMNTPAPIRQTAVGYLASALARSLFLGVDVVQEYLLEMCTWIRQYIQRCDSGTSVFPLKAHGPFFATCQALFYVISFRSRELTSGTKNLLFLQSLQLNSIVTSALNPLRVCQPAVATAFSGVTRAHQLAYCHTILERNARKKLATISGNDLLAPVESLDTFFPFDQYMLKKSGRRIEPIYRQYQASEAEERINGAAAGSQHDGDRQKKRRNARDAEEAADEVDFIVSDKRCKVVELSKSFDRDLQFYNTSAMPKK